MFGRRGTTDNPPTATPTDGGNLAADQPSARPTSTLGGWARAIGWGSLAVAGCGAILLLVRPVEVRWAPTRSRASRFAIRSAVPLVQPAVPATAVPTMVSTPGQVPFARSPTR